MADGSTFWTLVWVVVGGLLTMAGGWFVEWRKQAVEKKRQRVQKFEELIAAVYELDHWMHSTRNVTAFGDNIVDLFEVGENAGKTALTSTARVRGWNW